MSSLAFDFRQSDFHKRRGKAPTPPPPPVGAAAFGFTQSTLLQRAGAAEHIGGFQVVGIEEGSHLIGQLGQDTLRQGHAASLQQGETL